MKGEATKNILNYMNALSQKKFTYIQVSFIASAIKAEYKNRKNLNLSISVKTKTGKQELNERIATIVNNKLSSDSITAEDVRLYKRCFSDEYTERTGKCSYGFKDVRRRFGYDPETGYEIK